MTPELDLHRSDSTLLRSVLYPYSKNTDGAWDRFLHVRLELPGRRHPSPRQFDSDRVKDCAHA